MSGAAPTTRNSDRARGMDFRVYQASLTLVVLSLLPNLTRSAPFTGEPAPLVVLPERTDERGRLISFELLPPLAAGETEERHYFKIDALGKTFRLNVSESGVRFISGEHTVEYHSSGGGVRTESGGTNCRHFTGSVIEGEGEEGGWTAISYCSGLRGIIGSASHGYLFIEPAGAATDDPQEPQPHLLHSHPHTSSPHSHCAYEKTGSSERVDEDKVRVRRSPGAASTSSEHWVEVAVVADHTMLEYHGSRELEAYLFTLMNMVSHLYRDPSIGHAVNIIVTRTVILESEQNGLSISTDALNSLASFCNWQSTNSPSFSSSPDVSLLITRANICEGFGGTCETLGIAEFKGACSPGKSCSISEDIGLATAFTIAHELGHSLGIRHDGDMSVMCEPDDHYIMAPTFAQSHNPHIWSHCSRQQLADFLLSPESSCLRNEPVMAGANSSSLSISSGVPLPGLETTPTEQCQLMLGDQASHCGLDNSTDFCGRLWCRADNQSECDHHHIPPAPGTECLFEGGRRGVCHQGSCVELGSLADPVEGGWGEWGEWEPCSLTCGTGVQGSSRLCDSPTPANGGRYCLGASHRHQTCNHAPCPAHSDIRQELCDSEPPHSRYTQWQAPSLEYIQRRNLDQCSHHCLAKPDGLLFTLTMGLPDGTTCIFTAPPSPSLSLDHAPVPESVGVCVGGECVPVGCDKTLHSMAVRDPCGVWCGNGSTCVPVSDTYTIPPEAITDTSDYIYHRTVTIPRGSGQVKISELHPTHNLYLAATTPTENFNGNYRVKEGELGSYWFAGVKWWYERPEGGIEVLRTAGVVKDDVTVFIITNSRNHSILYSAGVPLGNVSIFEVGYEWRLGDWGRCEGVCGEGVRTRTAECVVGGTDIVVSDDLCDLSNRSPTDERCFTDSGCEYDWRVGPWDDCNITCGAGVKTRDVHCTLTSNHTVVEDRLCWNKSAPVEKTECYSEQGCVYQWEVGQWGNCSSGCGEGERGREVACVLTNSGTAVDHDKCGAARPPTVGQCYSERGCVYVWQVGEWSECSSHCGEGQRERLVSCVVTSNGSIVDPSLCSPTVPTSNSSCYSEERCSYEWIASDWNECSTECGLGTRRREVSCVLTNNATTVEDGRCQLPWRPSREQDCYSERGCVFVWTVGDWGRCDSVCGWGERRRDVACLLTNNNTNVNRQYCDEGAEPDATSRCHSNEGCVYSWQYGNWTSCSTECGRGTRSREVSCYLTNNDTGVDGNHCPRDSQPTEVDVCQEESGCVFVWASEPWSDCNSSCGSGHMTRRVSCLLMNNVTTVGDEFCLSGLRPAVERSCYSERGCVYEWETSDWGACSALCGEGERQREVHCTLTNNRTTVDDGFCIDSGVRPEGGSRCSEEDCRYEWRVGDWGGCEGDNGASCEDGRRWREVECVLLNNQSVVEEGVCVGTERPSESSSCWLEGCEYVVVMGEWGACSAGCGDGLREREVHCERRLGEGVPGVRVGREMCGADWPNQRESCSAEPCSNFAWDKGEWSKCDAECNQFGSQTRPVTCQHKNGTVVPDSPYCTSGKLRPSVTKQCRGEPCTGPPEVCQDNSRTSCNIIIRLRLCHVPHLRRLCCQSCS